MILSPMIINENLFQKNNINMFPSNQVCWIACAVLHLISPSTGIIAYDCGHENINISAVSLIQVQECLLEQIKFKTEPEEIQLIQLSEAAETHTYQCKINIIQTVFRCGMFSHLSLAAGGLSTFIEELSYEQCMTLHKLGTFRLPNGRIIANIKPNSTSNYSEVIAGYVDEEGKCQGTPYTFGGHSWSEVVVMQAITITLTDCISLIKLSENKIVIRDKLVCTYLDGQCVDPEYGMTFWEITSESSCEGAKYDVLWEGKANKITNLNDTTNSNAVYTVNTEDRVFALEIRKEIPVCRLKGYQTEHPRLIIVPKVANTFFFTKKPINSKGLDIFMYINSKFVYTERHFKNQIERLYMNLLIRKCELEREMLQTQLSLAPHFPEEFALRYMKTRGYTAVPRGEVIYVVKCQPVEVTVRSSEKCYMELPVSYGNKSFFLTPKTHLLQEIGTEIACSPLINPAYNILGEWYGLNPTIHKIKAPTSLRPSSSIEWHYEDPGDLMQAGVFSFETLSDMRRQIMYSSERRAITNIVTKRLLGEDIDHQEMNVLNLLTPGAVHTMTQTLKNKLWELFTEAGRIYLALLGIYAIFKILKFLGDTAINIRRLHKSYGWNWRMAAGTWNVLTNYIIQVKPQTRSHNVHNAAAHLTSVSVPMASKPTPNLTNSQPLSDNIQHLTTLQERISSYTDIPQVTH